MKKEKHGYGYSYWKPLLIKQILELINEDDVIHYADLGCHLNQNGLDRLEFYLSKLLKVEKGILAFGNVNDMNKEENGTDVVVTSALWHMEGAIDHALAKVKSGNFFRIESM